MGLSKIMAQYTDLFKYIDKHPNTTVLTVNRRLSQFLNTHYATYRQSHYTAWATPDILPYVSWQKRILTSPKHVDKWCEYIFLNKADELIVWEQALQTCGIALQDTHSLAPLAQEAWERLRQWQVPDQIWQMHAHADQIRLKDWINAFETQCQQQKWLHNMQWIPVIIERAKQNNIALAENIILVGFDKDKPIPILNTLQQCLIAMGKTVSFYTSYAKQAKRHRIAFECTQDEYRAMAQWACQQVEQDPTTSIGCIIPNLTQCREDITNAFMSVAYPLACLPGQQVKTPLFNIAGGAPLAEYPIIHCALLCFTLLSQPLSIDEWQALLDSPYLAGFETENTQRARLAHALTQYPFAECTLKTLLTLADIPPIWQQQLQALQTNFLNHPAKQYPSEWITILRNVLTQLGWPGRSTLSSEDYQLVERFWALLDECKQSDLVLRLSNIQTILTHIRQRCQRTIFQKQSSPAPIQIIGTLESAGLIFDQVWFMHCHSKQWPEVAKPNPLIALSVQRQYKTPHCSAERELDFATDILKNLIQTTDRLYCSYACYDEDKKQHPSPLILDFAEYDFSLFNFDLIQALPASYLNTAITLEDIDDTYGKPLTGVLSGGSALLKDYNACPFRAYVKHRLGAKDPWRSITQNGFSPAQRGILAHKALELAWTELVDQKTLIALSTDELANQSQKWANQALAQLDSDPLLPTSRTLVDIELTRLAELIYRWLMQEKDRPAFEVIALEKKISLSLSDLTLSMRLDRLDTLTDGSLCVIDYKTGNVNQSAWFGDRIDEPQLPLYCIDPSLLVKGIAFAKIAYQKPQFIALLENAKQLPNGKTITHLKKYTTHTSWQEQVNAWQAIFTEQANAIEQASALIDPKDAQKTCDKCHLASVCRYNMSHHNENTTNTR